MKKITLLLSSLFFFSLGTSACSDEAPSGNTEKPELPVNPEPPVTPSETLKGSFESKFVRYAKGQKFTGQEDDRLVTTVWKDTVWQNERVHKQIVLWTESKRYDDLTYEIGDLLSGGNRIASSNLHLRFPSYVLGDEKALVCNEYRTHTSVQIADKLSEEAVRTVTASEPVKLWLTADIPAGTAPGEYEGTVTVKSGGEVQLTFTVRLLVVNHALPPVSEWAFHLDLWQFPFQLSGLCADNGQKVTPFSSEYFTLVKPFYQLLADAGQKVITAYIKDGAFNKGQTMVKWHEAADGKWSFDYTGFDKFVAQMMSWGIGRQISCFSLVGWNTSIGYTDASGEARTLKLTVGSDEYRTVWNEFLDSFERHLKTKGWFEKTVLYMDEIREDEMRQVVSFIKQHNPDWKIGLAGSAVSSDVESAFYDYSTILGYDRTSTNAVATFYTSCAQGIPNAYVSLDNNPAEMVWVAWYAKAKGLNGFLRWAYDYWTKADPQDVRDGNNTAGDFSLIYRSDNSLSSVPLSSIRLELLREGIQDYEKMRILSTNLMNPVVQKFTLTSGRFAGEIVTEAQGMLKKISAEY